MTGLLRVAQESLSELYASLGTSESGLPAKNIQGHIKKYGLNKLVNKDRFKIFKLLWESFFSPLVLLLLVAGFISSLLGDVKDFLIIFAIVILSGGITFYQHFKADHASEALKKKVQLTATVIRNGVRQEIPFSHIVPGDIVLLTPGDIIPADGRIIEGKDFAVDESTLTGESFPAEKSITLPKKSLHTLSSLSNLVFAGTHVVSGEATSVIFATGKQTQLGQLSQELIKPKPPTDFDIGLEKLSIILIKVILLLSLFVFGVNAFIHHEIITSFTFAVALAVGLTPELMPVILTVNLSRGALRMEKKEVIVKYLPSIQNFGSIDMLCTDKTGTLTENATTLVDYTTIQGSKSPEILHFGILASSLKSGAKDPLDTAILKHQHEVDIGSYEKLDEIPFDFDRKRASVVVHEKLQHITLITKGAPQKVLPLCTSYKDEGKKKLTQKEYKSIEKHITDLNKQGFRVIVVAEKPIEKKPSYTLHDEKDLCLLGLLVFHDPVKESVASTVKELEALGITIKILTGDSELVTEKVCTDLHIPIEGILLGEHIETMTHEALAKEVEHTTIFARLTPEQKSKIIFTLRKNGHVVGYMGDGINDAPPLKAADVGISVHNGSDIARDVADIVLMRKSLSILREGIIEGRKTHGNIIKYILMSLSSNFGNMISVAIASLFLPFLPLLPTQVLLIDFLYDLSQITIPTDKVDEESIQKPQRWDMGFLKKFMLEFGPISSFFDLCTFGILLYIFHASVPLFRTGWFMESVVSQTLIVFAIRTRRIPFFKSLPSIYVVVSAILSLILGFLLVYGKFANIFSFTRLPLPYFLFLVIILFFYFTVVETGKIIFYRLFVK